MRYRLGELFMRLTKEIQCGQSSLFAAHEPNVSMRRMNAASPTLLTMVKSDAYTLMTLSAWAHVLES